MEMRNGVRLLGGAALPAHLPPYVGTKAYRARHFAQQQTDGTLFCLHPPRLVGGAAFRSRTLCHAGAEANAGREADQADGGGFVRRPEKGGIAVAPRGKLWFDLGAAEWFLDTSRNRYVLRIAVPDLPTPLWDEVAQAVVQRWSVHEEQKSRFAGLPTNARV